MALLIGTTREEFRLFLVPTGVAAAVTSEALPLLAARYGWPPRAVETYAANRPGGQQRQGLRGHRGGDAGGHEEEPELLTRRANEQCHAGGGPLSDERQGDVGDELAVDDGEEGHDAQPAADDRRTPALRVGIGLDGQSHG